MMQIRRRESAGSGGLLETGQTLRRALSAHSTVTAHPKAGAVSWNHCQQLRKIAYQLGSQPLRWVVTGYDFCVIFKGVSPRIQFSPHAFNDCIMGRICSPLSVNAYRTVKGCVPRTCL